MKYLFICFFSILCLLENTVNAQVFSDEYLSQTHKGTLKSSVNYSGDDLDFVFELIEDKSKVVKLYELKLYHRNTLLNTYNVQIRNLIVTCYFEIELNDKKGTSKTLTGIFDKGNKWMRVKFAPQENCSNPNQQWERYSNIKSFEAILHQIIYQMDKNLVLDCYVQ